MLALQYFGEPLAVREEESIPTQFSLSQNFPNPFNPTTEIRFEVGGLGFVSLKIYDILGRVVATLVNENLSAGSYIATWDASKFPSGMYFYKLQAGTFSKTKKLILLK